MPSLPPTPPPMHLAPLPSLLSLPTLSVSVCPCCAHKTWITASTLPMHRRPSPWNNPSLQLLLSRPCYSFLQIPPLSLALSLCPHCSVVCLLAEERAHESSLLSLVHAGRPARRQHTAKPAEPSVCGNTGTWRSAFGSCLPGSVPLREGSGSLAEGGCGPASPAVPGGRLRAAVMGLRGVVAVCAEHQGLFRGRLLLRPLRVHTLLLACDGS